MTAQRFLFDESKLQSIFSECDIKALPGAAVGVAMNGVPIFRHGYGVADVESLVRLSPATCMRIGSVTKHMACLAYLLLCDSRKASIEDEVGRYLPQLHAASRGARIYELMSNTSGLRDALDVHWQFSGGGQHVSSQQLLSYYRDIEDTNTRSCRTWIYNNGGFLLLSAVIEEITGRSLEEVLRDSVFLPIGMERSALVRFDMALPGDAARLHTLGPEGLLERSNFGTALAGEGGAISTIDDMLRWLAHMEHPIVGSAWAWKMMRAPQVLHNGTSTDYGLGLMCGRFHKLETMFHPGGVMGGSAHVIKLPEVGLDVVVLVNRHDLSATTLANRVVAACLGEPHVSSIDASDQRVSGLFRSSSTGRVIRLGAITSHQYLSFSQQQIASIDGFDLPVRRDGDTLVPIEEMSYYKWRITPLGFWKRPDAIKFTEFGNVDELALVPASEGSDLERILGEYRVEQLGISARIVSSGKKASLVTMGRFGSAEYDLNCMAEGIWRASVKPPSAMTWGGVVTFAPEYNAFRYSCSQTRRLRFERLD